MESVLQNIIKKRMEIAEISEKVRDCKNYGAMIVSYLWFLASCGVIVFIINMPNKRGLLLKIFSFLS